MNEERITKKRLHKLIKASLPHRSWLCGADHDRWLSLRFDGLIFARKIWVQSKSPVWYEIYKRYKYEALLI